ncbi:thiol peroxidase [Tunicatimonas pelagia]|uniref:thiol peroxidase n=1 Tax=Tunicatimonas pelagia TaxID=931531 RepID=UPI0026659B39|nr:thiol peroxidase [Tunicatimonas pelagia]WKN41414.1 thiol peroxidase [Tunicatimonas pelagia]
MASVTLGGNPVSIKGDIPTSGVAPDFAFVQDDMSENKLSDLSGVKVLIAVPSLDTSVCATETRQFNQQLGGKSGATGLVISKDLPFAMKRFCETAGVESIVNASDFRYGEFGEKYNTEITEGPFKGLSARAVFVVDQNNEIVYAELVPEVGEEPNYDKAMEAVDKLL